MRLSVKHLRLNEYTHSSEEVPEGTPYGFWRIVEHTGSGWFEWDGLYNTREEAEKRMAEILAAEQRREVRRILVEADKKLQKHGVTKDYLVKLLDQLVDELDKKE